MALFRALESTRAPDQRLFDDQLAQVFLRRRLRAVAQAARVRPVNAALAKFIDRRWPGARASGVARTRLIDDWLRAALAEGVDDVVILGTGFDCRAYRIPGIERTRVVEVDQPATQRAKRDRVERALGGMPPHVTFAEIDFNRQRLDDVLPEGRGRTYFIWEGVTNYLTAEAVDATLRSIQRLGGPGSRLAFTYVDSAVLEDDDRSRALVAKVGEPWTFGLDPNRLRAYLAERGLDLVEDVGSTEYRRRYMKPHGAHLRGYEFYRAAEAAIRAEGL